jgi:hypothetical protein
MSPAPVSPASQAHRPPPPPASFCLYLLLVLILQSCEGRHFMNVGFMAGVGFEAGLVGGGRVVLWLEVGVKGEWKFAAMQWVAIPPTCCQASYGV